VNKREAENPVLELERPERPSVGFVLACPICIGPLEIGSDRATCATCQVRFPKTAGIWDFLPADRAARYAEFLRAYQAVRAAEGWGSDDPAYYRSLPNVDPSDPRRTIWRQRAESYRVFRDRILALLETSARRPLNVLDLGAGNCWLSHRLAERGHVVAAVDLSTSATDGLGARDCYGRTGFEVLRGEFDRLPFADAQADLVILNAALHYSRDVAASLRESRRVLRPGGRVVVLDSPVYRDALSGELMIQERDERFRRELGVQPGTKQSEGFLTWARLGTIADELGLEWRVRWPVAGWRRGIRRARVWMRGQRESAEFPVLIGSWTGSGRSSGVARSSQSVPKAPDTADTPAITGRLTRGAAPCRSFPLVDGEGGGSYPLPLGEGVGKGGPSSLSWRERARVRGKATCSRLLPISTLRPHPNPLLQGEGTGRLPPWQLRPSPSPGGEGTRAGRLGRQSRYRLHPEVPQAPEGTSGALQGPTGRFGGLVALGATLRTRVGRLLVRGRFLVFDRHRFGRLVLEQVGPWPILVLPDVFNPRLFRTGEFLARSLDAELVPRGASVLDLGTGSGISAIAASQHAGRIVAVDVNPEAVRCARINLQLNRVGDKIEVIEGDLFAPVAHERFDVVVFNPPFFRGEPRDLFDRAWRSPDVVERFAAELPRHLTPAGHALVVLSSDGEAPTFLRIFHRAGLSVDEVARRRHLNETLTIYRLRASGDCR